MNKKKKRIMTIILTISIVLSVIGVGTYSTYLKYFYPKTLVKSINTPIELDKWGLLFKFLPDNLKLTFKEIYVESDTKFTQEELTDMTISVINEIPQLKKYITGLCVKIEGAYINIYVHFNYKNIPLEAKLTFTGTSLDGKGIFHYVSGNIGFINITKDFLFSKLEDTSIVQFNTITGDIILSFEGIKQLQVKNVIISNNNVEIIFRGTLKFKDILSK